MPGQKSIGQQTRRVLDGVELGIQEGTYPKGTAIPSYRALCDLYDVSINTVRSAIDVLVERGLLYRKERSGTFVRVGMPETNASQSIGLRCVTFIEKQQPPVRVGFHRAYMPGYSEALENLDVKMRFEEWREEMEAYGNLLADGLAAGDQGCVLVNFVDAGLMEWLESAGVPFVVEYYCYYPTEGLPPHHRVYVNKAKAGFDATQRLLEIGHERIGFAGLSGLPEGMPGLYDGYRAALLCAGEGPRERDIMDFSTDEPEAALGYARRFLGRADLPTAMFCKTDALALAFLEVAEDVGIEVPGDLSVVGFNDLPGAARADPPLTTVASPRRLLGRTAVELLLTVAEKQPSEPQRRVLECHLRLRESTAPPGKRAAAKPTG